MHGNDDGQCPLLRSGIFPLHSSLLWLPQRLYSNQIICPMCAVFSYVCFIFIFHKPIFSLYNINICFPDQLHALRKGLVEGCNKALIKALLDDLLDGKILNDGEVEYIDEENRVPSDKMRVLVDSVRKKGDASSNFLIQKVAIRDSMLSAKLGITGDLLQLSVIIS